MNKSEREILQKNKVKLIEVFRDLVLLSCTDDAEYLALMNTMRQSVGSISILEIDYCENNPDN